eukprot:TRINITY_DN15969_c0_g1_i1.p1 TRINITY_DN15969_c0_g1~~TRINITY_DN15969_c0_g1_i1.p1  ORF type:complete len:107 (+),score=24.39 TRINITY_DN15969_c0_g1_i1:28-348(+)
MSYSEENFKKSVSYVNGGPPIEGITNDIKLKFYAYFKQATDGPCKEKAPSRLQVIKKMKWDAYNKLGKMTKEEARKSYINELEKLVGSKWKTYQLQPNTETGRAKL